MDIPVDFSPENLAKLAALGVTIDSMHGERVLSGQIRFEPPTYMNASFMLVHKISIGAFTRVNGGRVHDATIGRYCSIAAGACIVAGEHPVDWLSSSFIQYGPRDRNGWRQYLADQGLSVYPAPNKYNGYKHTIIGNDVWIGLNAYIGGGLTIGDGAIIGAHSVVTKDVPPYMIVAGNPAKIIRPRFPEKLIERLLSSRWWQYALPTLPDMPYDQPEAALDRLDALIAQSKAKPYEPSFVDLADFFAHGG